MMIMLAAVVLDKSSVESQEEDRPSYRDYFYNFSHPLSGDYVYRTGRVFTMPGESKSLALNPVSAIARARKLQADAGSNKAEKDKSGIEHKISALAGQLISHAKENIAGEYVIAVTTLVNLNSLYRTSSLGRFIGEQFISEFQQAGIDVIEIRKSPNIMVSRGHGEYALSREMEELDFVHNIQAMLVGTYTVSGSRLFVNVRLLAVQDGMVISTANIACDLDQELIGMLADEGLPAPAVDGSTIQVRTLVD